MQQPMISRPILLMMWCIVELANNGYQKALQNNPHLLNGLNVYRGHVTCKSVAQALDLPYVSAASILA